VRQTWSRYHQPGTLDEALALVARLGARARVVAGATDVLVELSRGVKPTRTLIDITRIADLRGIVVRDAGIRIGGLATHNDVLESSVVRDRALPLWQACLEIGAPQLRARATVAGNIVTGSPANDTISALMALDAEVELHSIRGSRTVPIAEFYPGFRQTVLAPDELVTAIVLPPLPAHTRGMYVKLGLRRAQAISVIHFAVVVTFEGEVVTRARVAYGCLAPTVVRGAATEAYLTGKRLDPAVCAEAGEVAQADVAPIADIRGSAEYRRRSLARLLADALERLSSGREREGQPEAPPKLESDKTYPRSSSRATPLDGIDVTINGIPRHWSADATCVTLLDALRVESGLTGAKEGCAEGECGACTVWLGGAAVMACLVPAGQAHGSAVTTIEGLATRHDGGLHPLQQAFVEEGAVQCGFCIPGMIMAGAKLLDEQPDPDLPSIQAGLSGNLCRCTGYRKIFAAMRSAGSR